MKNNIYFYKDRGILLCGFVDPQTGRYKKYTEVEKKYLDRMNENVCGGCGKRGNCLKTMRYLVVNCLEKGEAQNDKS